MKFTLLILALIFSGHVLSQHGGNRQYRDVFHSLLKNHHKIERSVDIIKNGVRTKTTSSDADIAKFIKRHVDQMKGLIENGRRIRNWDPLFSAIFDHYELIEMKINEISHGVEVVETSNDPFVAKLIVEHAKVVSLFVKHGFEEAHRSHPLPQ